MPLHGSVETVNLVDLLSLIHGAGHAGTLKLGRGEEKTKLHFFRGQIYLPTGGSSGALKIGALLVRAGKLSGRDLLRALQLQKKEGHQLRLGDLLVREGLVTRADRDEVIRAQFEEDICDRLFEEDVEFEFKKDVLPAGFTDARGNIQALGFDIRSILMEASRRQDEWRQIRSVVPSGRAVLLPAEVSTGSWHVLPGGEVAPERKRRAGGRSPAETSILTRWQAAHALFQEQPFDGLRSVDEVVAASGISAFTAMGVIAELRQGGLLQTLSAQGVESEVLRHVQERRLRDAYRLYGWANESDRLRRSAQKMDKALLHAERLDGHSFHCRTPSVRALQILSRLIRRRVSCVFRARGPESKVDLYYTPQFLRLHLTGPRRTHSTTRYLRRRKAISNAALGQARETSRMDGRPLDRVLVEDGFVDRKQWLKAVKDKVVSGLFSIFGWPDPELVVHGGTLKPPTPDEVSGLVCEIPLSQELLDSLHRDLLRWKVFLKVIPSPDIVCVCLRPTPPGKPRRAHDLFNGRRTVGDLIQLARVAPLELVRFVYDSIRKKRVRPLSDKEHYQRCEQARRQGHLDEAIVYAKSAIALGHQPRLYAQRLEELRKALQDRPNTEHRPVLQGDVSTFSLAEVLQLLHQGHRTGTLKVRDGEREKVLYLDGGDLHVLKVEESECEQEVWDLLMGDETRHSFNLESILKGKSGMLQEDQLGAEELESLKEDLYDTFLWEGAEFEFTQNLLPSELRDEADRSYKVKLRTDMFLMSAMARLAEWDELRRVLRSARAVFEFVSADAKLAAVKTGSTTAYIYDGKHSLADVVRISGENRFKVYREARELVESEALAFKHMKQVRKLRRPTPLASGRLPRGSDLELGASQFSSDLVSSDMIEPYMGDIRDSMSDIP